MFGAIICDRCRHIWLEKTHKVNNFPADINEDDPLTVKGKTLDNMFNVEGCLE